MRSIVHAWTVVFALALVSCGQPPPPVALPLIDLFQTATVDGTVQVEPIERTEWRFDGEGTVGLPEETEGSGEDDNGNADDTLLATYGWEAYNDIDDLMVREGDLVGTTGALPLLHTTRPAALDENDLLHSVEIAMRVSEGSRLA